MWTAMLIAIAVVASAMLASRFMWWSAQRSGAWALAAGAVLAFAALAGAVLIAWWMTRAALP
jgi:hypothetical protein